MPKMEPRVAVLLPCYNEEASIGQTISGFREHLPTATIYVCDNNSSDSTVDIARRHGAIVLHETAKGKGNVVRRMFSEIDADFYVMADGDATYDASAAPRMVAKAADERLDMVVGCRHETNVDAYRQGHRFGNKMLTALLAIFFGRTFTDILSGYRVFSKRFVKSFPAFSSGFQIETEISVHALRMRLPLDECETDYFSRPEGSHSKLSTYKDGVAILSTIVDLVRQERPLLFFSLLGLFSALVSILIAIPIISTYLATGLVPRFPTAILSAAMMVVAILFLMSGLILDTVVRGRREALRLAYLAISPFGTNNPSG